MTAKEKEKVNELLKYAKAMCRGHYGIKEILEELIKEVEKLIKK